jgi:hypothetical protein
MIPIDLIELGEVMRLRAFPHYAAVVVSLAGLIFTAAPAAYAASGSVTVSYSNGSAWPAPPNGPTNMYSSSQSVLATSTTGNPVAFSATGGCTVVAVASNGGPASQAKITGTNGSVDCVLTASSPAGNGSDAASVTYTLKSVPTGQSVKYGSVMSKSKVNVKKTYVLGTYPLKTSQGKTVTFKINTGSKYCTVKKDTSKGWLLTVGSKTGKCSVLATAAAVSPNYAALNRQQYWSVVK